ncbi:MAG: hypothetical protein H7Z39_04720, partial [Burkholderiaceae bacterium]|nr:hypothetical protein [Burkholderiaceae bacterium]
NDPTGKSLILKEGGNGAWGALAELDTNVTQCAPLAAALRANLRAGQFQPIPARLPDLQVGGQRVRVFDRASRGEPFVCPTVAKP